MKRSIPCAKDNHLYWNAHLDTDRDPGHGKSRISLAYPIRIICIICMDDIMGDLGKLFLASDGSDAGYAITILLVIITTAQLPFTWLLLPILRFGISLLLLALLIPRAERRKKNDYK